MIQVALFLVILFAVTWPLGFLLPSILGTGSVWKFLCSIADLGLGANDHCSDVDAMDGEAIRAEKRTPFTSELPPRFDSMVDTGGPGSHTRLRNRDVQRAGGWRRSS